MGLLKSLYKKARGKTSKARKTASRMPVRHKGTVNKLRNQVLKLKLKKQKIKAQRELLREQMRI